MKPQNTLHDVAAAGADRSIAALIDRWQSDHDGDALARLLEMIRLPLERVVRHTLRRHGVRDPGACDDAWALVIEHLARLGTTTGRRLAAFDAQRAAECTSGDPGWAYVRCVARARAGDVARNRRRRDRHVEALEGGARDMSSRDDAGESLAAAGARLRVAVAGLDERSQTVITLLLEGKSQAVIAHMLGVCEGTVSRIRAQAIARLRALLAE